jgi:hypothetical protein
MKKVGSLLAFLLAFIMVVTACAPTATTLASTTDPYGSPNTTTGTTYPITDTGNDHDCTTTGTTGTTESTTSTTTDTTSTTTGTVTPKKSIKVLAIGNSFSVDAMEHLAVILKGEGYDEIVLGDLYIGGCSLDTHWNNIKAQPQPKAYTFYTNTGNGWSEKTTDIQTGIDYADWDFITIQQVSQDSGRPETFGNLQNIIDHVKKTQPDAKIYWHMTWAYQASSSHAGFANYGKNQMNMYKAITDAVKTTILTNSSIDGVIPSGTAVQNLRVTYGDLLTRDGFHLTYGLGRYTAALMWYKQLTGASIDDLTAMPSSAASEISKYIDDVKAAVNSAYEKPYEVAGQEEIEDLTVMTDADKAHLVSLGLDPAKYEVLDLGLVYGAYYSSKDANSKLNGSSSISSKYIATSIFTSQILPAGAVVKIADGYQYRLEGWQKLDTNNSVARRDNSTVNFTVTAELYDSYNFIAFNISKKDNSAIKPADGSAFRIYVPKTEKSEPTMTDADKEYLTSKGLNPDNYEKLYLGYTMFAYYNATSGTTSNIISSKVSNAGNLVNFLGTRIITKEEMPVGSVIRLDTGYQYRPERFVELGKAPAKRGDNIKTGHVVVDEAWWGAHNYVGFNVAFEGNSKVVSGETGRHFVIYVPKAN